MLHLHLERERIQRLSYYLKGTKIVKTDFTTNQLHYAQLLTLVLKHVPLAHRR